MSYLFNHTEHNCTSQIDNNVIVDTDRRRTESIFSGQQNFFIEFILFFFNVAATYDSKETKFTENMMDQ